MDAVKFIGIGHKKQQGKDTLACMLVDELNEVEPGSAVVYSFATPLKRFVMDVYGLTFEQCYGSDAKKNSSTEVPGYHFPGPHSAHSMLTARQVMQGFGVAMRERFPCIWVNAPFLKKWDKGVRYVVIPDVRFDDEAHKIKASGGTLVKIERPAFISDDPHESENGIRSFDAWDHTVLNDRGLGELGLRAVTLSKTIRATLRK